MGVDPHSFDTHGQESNALADVGSIYNQLLIGPEFKHDYWFGAGVVVPPYFIDSQRRGEVLPAYLNWWGLKVIRDRSRRYCVENEIAVAALRNRQAFIFGTGFKYRYLAHKQAGKGLEDKVQKVIDVFCEVNRMSEREREIGARCDKDGEAFIRFFPDGRGLLELRWVEPEHVRPGDGDESPQKSFGIECNPTDVESVRGYYIVEDPIQSNTPKYVKAEKILHVKRNVDSSCKRGLPLLYPVEANLRRAERLRAAATTKAEIAAKIALIRHVEGASRTAADRLKSEVETGQEYDPITGGVRNVEQFALGTILTSSKNLSYEIPKADGSGNYDEAYKAELRAVAACLVMPEIMLSADASGGSYTNLIVAESPATRNFEAEQRYYKNHIAESRSPRGKSILWRQIEYAVQCGILPQEAMTHGRIVATAPDIVPRDPDKAAAASRTYYDMGVTSPQQIAAELGLDWEKIQKERKEAGLPDPQTLQMGEMGGMQDGAMGDDGAMDGEGDESGDEGPAEFEFDGSDFI